MTALLSACRRDWRRFRSPVFVFAVVLIGCVALVFLATKPILRSRSLSRRLNLQWVTSAIAHDEILRMGPDALPVAVAKIGTKPSGISLRLDRLLKRAGLGPETSPWQRAMEEQATGYYIISILGSQAAPAIPQLVSFLSDPETAATAAEALQAVGDPALPAIRDSLTNISPMVRSNAVRALFPGSPQARAELLKLMTNGDWRIRCAAYQAIPGLAGTAPQEALQSARRAFHDTNTSAAIQGLLAARMMSDLGTNLLPDLYALRAQANTDPAVRAEAAGTIQSLERRMRLRTPRAPAPQ